MRKATRIKSMINHCVKVFNNNRDISAIDYSNHNERITIRRVEKEPKRAPMGFAVGDVIEPDDEEYGEYCFIKSNNNEKKSKRL